MKHNAKGVIERAFELAQDGSSKNLTAVRKRLKAEGYSDNEVDGHMAGVKLRKQLHHLCLQAQGERTSSE